MFQIAEIYDADRSVRIDGRLACCNIGRRVALAFVGHKHRISVSAESQHIGISSNRDVSQRYQ